MVAVKLKGVAQVTARGRKYYYAWRGGPRLKGEPGSPEFLASFNEAHQDLRAPDNTRFRSVVYEYKASQDWRDLAESTRRHWNPWLDRIAEYFGELRVAQFNRPEKIKPVIRKWRSRYAATPRTADYGIQVLSRVLSYAVDPLGRLGSNPCDGIKQLYTVDRSERIWTHADIAQLKAICSAEIACAVDLAAHTGLRLGDLLRLSWSHIGADAIRIRTGKSKQRREAIVPLYEALRAVIVGIPKRATTVLTNSHGRPWSRDGFGSSFNKAKIAAGLGKADLHFHDLRGTAATRFYLGRLRPREIAEIMGWEEDHLDRIIRRYVGRTAATEDLIRRLDERRT